MPKQSSDHPWKTYPNKEKGMNTFKEQIKKLLLEVRHGAYVAPKIEQICMLIEKEVIGEDEKIDSQYPGIAFTQEKTNEFRAEQRKIVSGEEKE